MENGVEESYLFDPELIKSIDWEQRKANFKNGISLTNPGETLVLRPLCISDFDKGFLDVLSQLTKVGDVDKDRFEARFNQMKATPNSFYVTVLEDTKSGFVIGTATLVVEQKFIHSCATRGRIEDVVVNSDYRGRQLGKLLVEGMTLLGKTLGVYKMSLECTEENRPFYEKHGYTPDGQHFMIQRFKP